LLRTPDGRLCILDWGLVTSVEPAQQQAIIAYITHLLAQDYAAVPQDLIDLGFISEAGRQALEDEVVVRAISAVFRGLASGGSARRRVSDVIPDIQQVRRRYGNIGQIPAYFAYILRTFSVLEGIGLDQDPEYSIASACYPYLASWLLRDEAGRALAVLEALIHAPASDHVGRPPLSAKKLLRLLDAFDTYTKQVVAPKEGARSQRGASASDVEDHAPSTWLRSLSRSSALQEVAAVEFARTVDVVCREALDVLTLPPLRGAVPPRTPEDEAVMNSLQDLLQGMRGRFDWDPSRQMERLDEIALWLLAEGPVASRRALREISRELPDAAATFVPRVVAALLERIAMRLEHV